MAADPNTGLVLHRHVAGFYAAVDSQGSNRTKSSMRVRVEHIFGAQANDMGGTLVRTIGMVRAKAKIGMKNLAYNMRRLGQWRRLNQCPA
jgi:IS5 family transposase